MREGILISAALHLAAITLAITGLPWLEIEPPDVPTAIPVEIVNVKELSAAPRPKPVPPRKARKRKAEPARRAASPPVPKDAVPTLAEARKPKPKPKPKAALKRQRMTAHITPRAKPKPPTRFDPERIAALLNKIPDEEEDKPEPEAAPEERKETKLPKIRSRVAELDRARLTASLRDAMRSQIERCWIIPAGARDAERLTIKIRIFLNPDGSLARPPEIVDQARMYRPGQEYFRVAAESARRAVQKCAPLKLPREHYDIWRESELTFDPSKMLG